MMRVVRVVEGMGNRGDRGAWPRWRDVAWWRRGGGGGVRSAPAGADVGTGLDAETYIDAGTGLSVETDLVDTDLRGSLLEV